MIYAADAANIIIRYVIYNSSTVYAAFFNRAAITVYPTHCARRICAIFGSNNLHIFNIKIPDSAAVAAKQSQKSFTCLLGYRKVRYRIAAAVKITLKPIG